MAQQSMETGPRSKSLRSSNLELYRIIVMLLIIMHHYVVNSGLTATEGPIYADLLSWRSLFLLLLGAWGKIGINCFVLISGYFMCTSRITAKKFFRLLGEVMFYRLVISLIFWMTGYTTFSISSLVRTLIPITTIGTGFTSAYLVFFLCIPFLNILIQHMNEKQHIKLLLLCSFLYIFLGTVPGFSVTMNYVSWFIVIYFIASYIRLYPKKLFSNKVFWSWTSVSCIMLSAVSVVTCAWRDQKLGRIMSDANTLLAVLTAISTFLFALNVKLKPNRFINTIAASTFGVLLIHANGDAMRKWLWQDLLDNVGVYSSVWMPLHAIGSVLLVFIICTIIDYIRIHFIESPVFNVLEKPCHRICKCYEEFESKLLHCLGVKD